MVRRYVRLVAAGCLAYSAWSILTGVGRAVLDRPDVRHNPAVYCSLIVYGTIAGFALLSRIRA